MRRLFVFLIVLAVALPIIAAGLAAWVLYTPGGLRWAMEQAERRSNGALVLDYATGTLGDGVRFDRLHYASPDLSISAHAAFVRVSPLSLIRLKPHVNELTAEALHIRLQPGKSAPSRQIEIPALPVALHIDSARVATLSIERDAQTTTLHDVFLRYEASATQHRLREVRVRAEGFTVFADVTLGTESPYRLEARTSVNRQEPAPSLSARLRAHGTLERFAIEVDAQTGGAHARARGAVDSGAELPIVELHVSVAGLDLRAFAPGLPHTELSADFSLAREGARLVGTAEATNAAPGAYDTEHLPVGAVRTRIQTDLDEVHLTDLAVDLGEGRIAGEARITRARVSLELTAHDLNLAALHGRLHATRLRGTARAALEPEEQSLAANLEQDGMRLRLDLSRRGDDVVLQEARLTAKGGEARGGGTIALNLDRPFTAHIDFKRFDPAAWGDFPRGAINGTVNAQGSADEPRARVRLAISDSRLNGAPLSAKGHASVAAERVSDIDMALQLGQNRATLRGGFGRRNDALALRVDAGALGTLDSALRGSLRANARISGTLKAPRIEFDASAEALHAAGVSVERAAAGGTVSPDPAAPLRLDARFSGATAQGRKLDRGHVTLSGTQLEHAATVNMTAAGVEIAARARGSWDMPRRAWSGTLAEFSSRGALDATLQAPVAVSAAPQRIAIGRVALAFLDGRIEATEIRYDEGTIATRGQFSNLPVLEIARALQISPRVGGTLRLSGAWSLVRDSALKGVLTTKRERGDIMLGPDGGLPIKLRSLDVEAQVNANRLQFRASLSSALANAETAGTVGLVTVDGRPEFAPESPLRFNAHVALAELGAIAPLIDANALLGGALDATLAGSGTVGKPLLTGAIRGERLAIALPPQGIDLKGGSLKAALHERGIRIDAFEIRGGEGIFTARGNLGMNGADSEVDWRADRLLLLGRPDRRLVVSGKGRAAMTDGKISLAGGVRAEEGYFEIGPDALPEPGPDVVVAGRSSREKPAPALSRMQLELVVNLGEAFRVRGRGLDTRLAGEITVATGTQGNLRAKGKLSAVRGVYVALGQRLEIERGELIFTGPIDNPGLDILAMRKRQAVEAGVAVTGTLESPLVRIVSEPPVPESEAIAWLVLGHGTGDASRGDLAMLPLAASSLLGKKGDSPTLAQRFGLDTLGLRGAGTESQVLAVGKRIADRLYVGFEQSLGAAASVLKLEFDLTQRVLVRAQTGEANSVGVFYRFSFD